MFDDLRALELSILRALNPDAPIDTLKPVAWDALGMTVLVPNWREFALTYRDALAPYRAVDLPDAIVKLPSIAAQIRDPKGMFLTREQRAERAAALLWTSFALGLIDRGWTLHAQPGDFYVMLGVERLNPSDIVQRLRQGTMSRAGFVDLMRKLRVDELPLAPPAPLMV